MKRNIGTDEYCSQNMYRSPETIAIENSSARGCALFEHASHLLDGANDDNLRFHARLNKLASLLSIESGC